MLENQPITLQAGTTQHTINTATLKAGLYFVNIVSTKGSVTKKLIVVK